MALGAAWRVTRFTQAIVAHAQGPGIAEQPTQDASLE